MTKILKFPSGKVPSEQKKIILKSFLSPGDIVMLTAAVRDLKKAHGDRFLVDVRTSCGQIWENNPYLTELDEKDADVETIEAEYPLIHRSNTSPYHFIHGYRMFLEDKLDIKIPATDFKGDIHLSDEEKSWISQIEEMGIKDDFWIINAGGKLDFTAKIPDPKKMQRVVDAFKGRISFVQIGSGEHFHVPLKGVINLIDKTDIRQLIRLVFHSCGILCPVTFVMHLAAAVEMKRTPPKTRPCVVIAGGREPASHWECYPHHQYLHSMTPCSDFGGCWKSRCSLISDGDSKNDDPCILPIDTGDIYKVGKYDINFREAKCINMITAERIISAIELYYEGGTL